MEYFFYIALVLSMLYTSTLTSSIPIFNLTTDEYALLAFKNAITSNSRAILSHNWSSSISICNWIGVSCGTKHCRVTALNVSGFHLGGTIPPHLGNLTFLRSLDLSSNSFTEILSWLGRLSQLEHLYLNNNTFSGTIPLSLFNISRLHTLDMGYNFLDGIIPKEIANFSYLETLKLGGNKLTGSIPDSIFNMSSMIEINLRFNNISGKLPYNICSNTPKLRIMSFSWNQLNGEIPANIHKCRGLEDLRLPINHFSGDIPREIGSLSMLRILSLYGNHFKGALPQEVGNLIHLQRLDVQINSLSGSIPSSIFNLSSLEVLSLARNKFSGSILSNIGMRFSLYNLEELYLDENRLSGEIPSFISRNASKLTILTLSKNLLSGPVPDFEIGNLSSLIDLRLAINQITGSIPRGMGNLQELQGLNLSNNHLQGDISTDLCKMSNLGDLDLSVNMLTGAIPDCFGKVKSLRNVHLYSNKLDSNLWNLRDLLILNLHSNSLSGQLSSQIGNLKQIYTLDLSSNQFLGDIPTTIDSCESLQYLSLSNNKLQGSIPKSLGNVRGLTTLDLSSNNLSGSIPKSLEQLKFLQYFNVSYNKLEGEIPNGVISSTAQSFVHNSALCGAAKFQVPPCVNDRGRSRTKTIALICLKYILLPFVAATIIVVVVLMFIRRHKRIIIHQAADISLETFVARRVSYIELVRGTSSFSETNLLGIGSFGSVYKATLSDGLIIAAKVFNLELEGATMSFDTESEILSSIRHRNLLPVISCCTNQEFRALILKYMPNGNLEKWLHSVNNLLDLVQRLNIAIDVALALEYLHHHHTFPVVHCDIKPSNVLLDEDMTAHVADFGISKLFDEGEVMTHTTTLATIGYAAPEYGSEGKVSTNGDVYSYGILVLEMFTQKKPTDDMFSEEMSLKDWVKETLRQNAISEIVAPGLISREDEHESVSSILDMAMKCLAFLPHERIDMIRVVAHLHKIKAKLQVNSRRNRQ
ncbi:hypothetical protein ACS0TY_028412 [Phlomoides rotata]